MILIVEGPDRVGKTTVIDALVQEEPQNQWVTIRNGKPPPIGEGVKSWVRHNYRAQLNAAETFDLVYACNVAIDRMHLSEYVYGKLWRGYDNVEVFRQTETGWEDGVALLVLVADPHLLIEREDGHSPAQTPAQREDEYDLFVDAFRSSQIRAKRCLNVGRMGKMDVVRSARDLVARMRTELQQVQEAV